MSQGSATRGRALRVAMVAACPFPHGRGTPIRIHRLAEAMARRGHEIHVVTYHLGDPVEDSPVQVHRIPNLSWYRHYAPGPTYAKLLVLDPLLVRTLRHVKRRHDIEIVHAHHYEGLLVAKLAGSSSCPLVYDAHTTLESELPFYPLGLPKRLSRAVGRALDRRLPTGASHVISVSEGIQARLLELGAQEEGRIDVIPNGVESHLFDVQDPDGSRPGDGRTIGFAGNLAPHQGIEYLLEAFRTVWEQRDEVRLVILSSSDFTPYEKLAADLGVRGSIDLVQVSFSELPQQLARVAVFVNPRVEATGLPMKLLNYMAAGRPIVSFAGSAVHLEDGKSALIVPSGDSRAMAAAILRLLEDEGLAARLGSEAKRQAREEFDWGIRAAQVEEVYRRVLARHGRAAERAS